MTTKIRASGLLIIESTGAIQLPRGTDAERPVALAGTLRYNLTRNELEMRTHTNTWSAVGASSSGGGGGGSGGSQQLSITNSTLSISGGNSVVLPDGQTLAISGTTLSISGGNSVNIPVGAGVVGAGVAKRLAYYPGTSNIIDDTAGLEWDAATSTLSSVATLSAQTFLSTASGNPTFTSNTDLTVITGHNVTNKTFKFDVDGFLSFTQTGGILLHGTGLNQITTPGDLTITANGSIGVVINGALSVSRVKFPLGSYIRVRLTAPVSSIGAAGDLTGDIVTNDTTLFYCRADYNGSSNIWVKTAWTTTGAW